MKIPNKREHQQIGIIYLSDIDFKDFMNIYKKCSQFFQLTIQFHHQKTLRFRQNL